MWCQGPNGLHANGGRVAAWICTLSTATTVSTDVMTSPLPCSNCSSKERFTPSFQRGEVLTAASHRCTEYLIVQYPKGAHGHVLLCFQVPFLLAYSYYYSPGVSARSPRQAALTNSSLRSFQSHSQLEGLMMGVSADPWKIRN